jgi:hypothetical protein
MLTPTYSFKIDPQPASLGERCDWRLLEDTVEVGDGLAPTDEDSKEALDVAHDDALEEATSWLRSRDGLRKRCGP